MPTRPTPEIIPATASEELAQRLMDMQQERRRVRNARLRSLLVWAVLISLLFHIGLMIYLHLLNRARYEEPVQEFQIQIATMLPEEELTNLPDSDLQEPTEQALSALDQLLDERQASELEADASSAEMEISSVGAVPTIGGAGAGGGGVQGIGGSGAAGSFFGITTTGRRFAYIVDISGSMEGSRLERAKEELRKSIRGLPDYAKFLVVFYNSDVVVPPDQETWQTARTSNVRRFIRWLDKLIAEKGTQPFPAFSRVFAEQERPDVIFFMTDGEITSMRPDQVSAMNRGGLSTVINTIAFGDDSSQDLLKQIAQDSGGVYRFVSVRGRP
ncbi:MAG: VWA domain-containing protein [Phycisphaerales bacterium]|nr:VWA domain-containing protein [Phycisphaerales bacterium]